jgi:iduronate 2-sulfatase
VHEEVYCLRGRNDHLLRTDRWALIRYGRGGVELYDMQVDPHQFTNLAGDPQHRQTLTGLLARLDDKLESIKQKRTFSK